MTTRVPPKLSDTELGVAERMAQEALARCAKVEPTHGNRRWDAKAHGGSCVPPMADAILALVAEVRELRRVGERS